MFVPVFGEVEEDGAAGDEGGIDAEFGGFEVAVFLEGVHAALGGVADAADDGADGLGLAGGRDGDALLDGFDQGRVTAFGKSGRYQRLDGFATAGGDGEVDEALVTENKLTGVC